MKKVLTTAVAILAATAASAASFNKVEVGSETVAYYDTGGEKPVIVLVHGNSSSSTSYSKQLHSNLTDHYRLVAIDLPGHGETGISDNPSATYSVTGTAQLIIDFLQQQKIDDGLLVGWSLGGHLVLEVSDDLPNMQGFAIFGTPPVGIPADLANAFLPNPAINLGFAKDLTDAQQDTYVDSFFAPDAAVPFSFTHDIRTADGNMRQGIAYSIGTGAYQDELAILASMTRPLAIFHGNEEQFVNADYLESLYAPTLWRSGIQKIYAAGHAAHYENPFEFNDLLHKFAQEVFAQ